LSRLTTYAPPAEGYAVIVCRYDRIKMASRAPMASATGNASPVATAPAVTRTSMICSVP
jgi:hypothetical protein